MQRQNRKSRDNSTRILVEARRKKVAILLQQSLTEVEIAQRLGVDVSTVSRDITTLKEQATQFVYDLARQDLAYFYKNTIDDINKARQEAWKIYDSWQSPNRDRLHALKVVVTSNVAMFNLLSSALTIMSVKALNERVEKLEQTQAGHPEHQEVQANG
jgi:predicted DNA-binding transcriptional regulator YafY